MAWTRCCDTCKFYGTDRSVGASWCDSDDPNWTDEEVTKYYENDEPNCPYHQYDWADILDYLTRNFPTKMDKLMTLRDPNTFWDDVRKLTRRVRSDKSLREWEICADNWYEYLTDDHRKEDVV